MLVAEWGRVQLRKTKQLRRGESKHVKILPKNYDILFLSPH